MRVRWHHLHVESKTKYRWPYLQTHRLRKQTCGYERGKRFWPKPSMFGKEKENAAAQLFKSLQHLPGWKHTFPIHLFKLHSALCMVACFKAINYSLFFWTITSSMAQMVKDLPAGSIPGLGGSPVNGNQLQYSCRETPMDRGAWWSQRVRPDWATNTGSCHPSKINYKHWRKHQNRRRMLHWEKKTKLPNPEI